MSGSAQHIASASTGGLSQAEALERLRRDGPNRLPSPQHRGLAAAAAAVAMQPMVLLLIGCTLLYALLGSMFDGIVLGASVIAVSAISIYQELRTQRVLEALRDLSSPRSSVVRDGAVRRIASEELVVGDRLIVQEGDRLACDARLVECHSIRVDESLLTGESLPVDKSLAEGAGAESGSLHAGSLVVQGDGVAEVLATGPRTGLGRIGGSLEALQPRPSRLHEELKRLVRAVALLAVIICLVAATVFAWREGSWTAGLLVGLTLAMSIVPEEFAVVWTVMLALGAWRLASAQVLTRQPQAIEALGTTTVLCVDKTGTLTANRMAVCGLADGLQQVDLAGEAPPAGFEQLLRGAALASVDVGLEPMDQAIFRMLDSPSRSPSSWRLLQREGVSPGRPFVRQCWQEERSGRLIVAVKGAPEAVLVRCSDEPRRLQALALQADSWSSRGLRVIAVAQATATAEAAAPEVGYRALGLLAFQDPLRAEVPAVLSQCRQAGVRVVMITGDAPATALAIARQAGLQLRADDDGVLTGARIDAMSEAELERAVRRCSVFARVTPAQKLRIVQALQHLGEVVAMTGDGVNDGPALRAADVGVAMGQRGTDVAREAAALVLLDDRFASLVDAVRAGRRIFANLQKAMGYLFAVHVPIIGLSLLPLFGGPVLLLPIHVVLLELIIDPACSLVFEAEPLAPDGMQQPPRAADSPLFSPRAIARALAVGAVALLAVVLGQWAGRWSGWGDAELRLTGLATIVAGNLLMLQWFREGFHTESRANAVFHGLLLGVCVLSLAILTLPPMGRAFGLPTWLDGRWVVAVLAAPAAWALWHLGAAGLGRGRREPGAAGWGPTPSHVSGPACRHEPDA